MRYRIHRIGLGSAIRLGCALGWLVTIPPALCLTGLAAQLLLRLHEALEGIRPITLSVLGQDIARIDLLATLQLRPVAETIATLVETLPMTLLLMALLLLAAGALLLLSAVILVTLGYNLLAALGWGLAVELHPE